ncbi:MAG: hypothetical protein ACTHMH_09805, partial [Curtobacterium sp.]
MSPLVQRSQWSAVTSDPADAAALVTRVPDVRRATVADAGAGFSFEERRRGSDLLSLVSMASTGVVDGTVEAESAMVLFWLKSGSGSVDGHGVPTGRPVLFRHDPQHVRWDGFQLDLIRIDRTTV